MKGLLASVVLALVAVLVFAGPATAIPISYTADLSGPAEAPPNASPGTGTAIVTIDTDAHTLRVQVSFSGLLGTTTAAHIHSPTPTPFEGAAGIATEIPTFTGFPLGVTSGTYDHLFDLTIASSFNPAFVTANGGTLAGAEAALASHLAEGRAYLNIHTAVFPGGEIRGFLTPVPEPSVLSGLGLGLAALLIVRRRLTRQP